MKDSIKKIASENRIFQIGFVKAQRFSALSDLLSQKGKTVMMTDSIEKRCDPGIDYDWGKSFIVCLLPYFAGGERKEISRYAWGKDYHDVMRERLSPICVYLESIGYRAEILCDNHNLNDRFLAYKAGLGFFGKNGFLINDDYGTYTFIGSIITDAVIEESIALDKKCMGCNKCIENCPGGAIGENGIDGEKCVSYITQKKGELTHEEKGKIKKSGYIWGCDMCQEVCPHNKNVKITDIDEFNKDLISSLHIDEDLSNKEFKRKYSSRAFTWRGKQTILRNIDIINDKNL